MRHLNKLVSALLATGNPQYSATNTKKVAADFESYYEKLADGATVYQEASSTVKFSFVTPPPSSHKTWQDDDVLKTDASLMDSGEESVLLRVSSKYSIEKPILVYLPGLDGFGLSAGAWQFDDMSRNFELWRMSLSVDDRSSFGDLVRYASDFCEQVSENGLRPVHLVGESFGGLLAPAVALNLQKRQERNPDKVNPLKGLVMVNPATSFDRSIWDLAAPFLTMLELLPINGKTNSPPFGLPSPYAVIGSVALGGVVPSSKQFNQIISLIISMIRPNITRQEISDFFGGYLDLFRLTARQLPADLVNHRVQNWLFLNAQIINDRLAELKIPTLAIIGDEDKLLGSKEEVERLEKVIPNFEKLVVKGAGHFVLDDSVNLTEAITYSHLDPMNMKETKKPYDTILDWKLPSQDDIDKAYTNVVKPLENNFSPIYFSTSDEGRRISGINEVLKAAGEGPIVIVSNHQLFGLDLNLVVYKLLQDGLTVRGLAHPVIFQGPGLAELDGRIPGLAPPKEDEGGMQFTANNGNFRKFGAVPVTPRNYYRLLQSGQNALLFPGGVREVFHGKDEAYQLFWPEKVDFVRTAARFNATIIPLSAIGMADSSIRVLDSEELLNLPVLGERAKAFASNVTAARFDTENADEVFLPPIALPSLPSRNYFLFGKPVRTADLNPKDKVQCEQMYQQIKKATQDGLDDLVEARKRDLFKDAPQRLAYERLTKTPAPSFDASVLN